jgi:hypothetical protein
MFFKFVFFIFLESCNIYEKTCNGTDLCRNTPYGPVCLPVIKTPVTNLEPKCSRACQNSGKCRFDRSKGIDRCYCSNLYFGDYCEHSGLIIFIISAVLLLISIIVCVILWGCFIKKFNNEQNRVNIQN